MPLFLCLSALAQAQLYQSPKLLFEEDCADGLFNGFGIGTNGNAWQFAGFAKKDTSINRPFPKAALRKMKEGTSSDARQVASAEIESLFVIRARGYPAGIGKAKDFVPKAFWYQRTPK